MKQGLSKLHGLCEEYALFLLFSKTSCNARSLSHQVKQKSLLSKGNEPF